MVWQSSNSVFVNLPWCSHLQEFNQHLPPCTIFQDHSPEKILDHARSQRSTPVTRNLWKQVSCTFPLLRFFNPILRFSFQLLHTLRTVPKAHPKRVGILIALHRPKKKYIGSVALLQGTVTSHFQSFRIYLEGSWQKWNSTSTLKEEVARVFPLKIFILKCPMWHWKADPSEQEILLLLLLQKNLSPAPHPEPQFHHPRTRDSQTSSFDQGHGLQNREFWGKEVTTRRKARWTPAGSAQETPSFQRGCWGPGGARRFNWYFSHLSGLHAKYHLAWVQLKVSCGFGLRQGISSRALAAAPSFTHPPNKF